MADLFETIIRNDKLGIDSTVSHSLASGLLDSHADFLTFLCHCCDMIRLGLSSPIKCWSVDNPLFSTH